MSLSLLTNHLRYICSPTSTKQLSAVLKAANKFKIPLWHFLRGKNLGYGGPAPRVNGSVALDLHKLDKIIEVNDEYHYAVVEPGVTFIQLYEYCVEHKKKVWPSTPSLGWGSVIGNTVDRGMGFGMNYAHHQCVAGMEVMLPDGDVIRTGQWGISSSPSAFLSKFTFGPSLEGLFFQSNLGVVTKMSLWLTPQPQAYMCCSFSMPLFGDLEVMVDVFGEMKRNGTVQSCVWFTSLIETLCIMGRREDYWTGEGPDGRLDATTVPDQDGQMFVGIPSLWSLPLINWSIPKEKKGGKAAHGDYAPVIPSSGKLLMEWMEVSKPICEANGVELMADFFMHERHVVLMNMFTWDQTDKAQKANMEKLYYGLYEEAKKRGYGMYRGHVNHMDLIANLNDFNNHAYNRFVEKIKDALDPNGILGPGKQGIWPNRFRHLRETQEKKFD
ncbi:putative vanillyl-alcohol oxidase [Triangularia setosa]|uniref:Vanillyl-alcohol oxidase n=1 Tax=Triangularia setosa TaxID=2587417 RepID=A0AAN6VXU8_9PEZI|nr:putative vanillyl-alcohol oxidase [Podospora setosa]